MEASTDFKITTLRRRTHYLLKKMEGDDSTNAKRFNGMEVEALQAGMVALEKEDNFDNVANALIQMTTAVEVGTSNEIAAAVKNAHDVVDKYKI